jgi:hypothetical protein
MAAAKAAVLHPRWVNFQPTRWVIFIPSLTLYPIPRNVVHPEHGKPNVWSIFCEAICVECGTVWRRDNTALILRQSS